MKTALLALTIASIAMPAMAQRVPVPPMSAEEVKGMVEPAELEVRLDGDFNGDGEIDTVFIARGEDKRELTAMLAYRSEVDLGHQPVGVLQLDAYPLGPANLSIRNGVLMIKDLTGGTSAVATTYRYRYDPKAEKMRLIGLDAKAYSRTNAHGWREVSWNLLTGDQVVSEAELNTGGGEEAYAKPVVKKAKRPSRPIHMENTPSPDDVFGGEN
ncbi:MAG: hypothetical protein Q8Q88_05110 [Phenylobacterium sp.]|uniref:hypothetical protein n=1 Tax=Phenylobacterium sp. TaxID=1871053 RepID=UPI002733B4DF|nr:hypothetical protein [Phenylobacterium sp.]MDP3746413.1 hypothetical protein [Phenylobacterium sp.]